MANLNGRELNLLNLTTIQIGEKIARQLVEHDECIVRLQLSALEERMVFCAFKRGVSSALAGTIANALIRRGFSINPICLLRATYQGVFEWKIHYQ